MKFSKEKLAVLGLVAMLAAPARGLWADEAAPAGKSDESVKIEAMEEAIEGLTKKTEYLDMFHMEGFADLRYDDVRTPYKSSGFPAALFGGAGTGEAGMYGKRAEVKIFGKIMPGYTYSLGYDFVANKIKDLGIEVADLQLIPFLDVTPEWTYQLKVGQYRQPFGIVPQTSSSKITLAERPLIYGGKQLSSPSLGANMTAIGSAKIVGERVMGLFVNHKKKFTDSGILAWEIQGAAANDTTEDQAVGQGSVTTGFPLQALDQDPSWQARMALNSSALDVIFGEKSKFQVGASYSRNSTNTSWMAAGSTTYTAQITDETYGAELLIEAWNKMLISQTEWIHQNGQMAMFPSVPLAKSGVGTSREGFYSDLLIDVLPLFTTPAKGDALQLIFRGEKYMESQTSGVNIGGYNNLVGAAGGLKYSYAGGKNHTAINYYVQAADGQFGGYTTATGVNLGGPSTMLVLQQQFAFE